MNFNFKDELETLEYSKIIECKAEEFLKLTFDSLREQVLNCHLNINSICNFKFCILDCNQHYELMVFCNLKSSSYDLGSMQFTNFEDAHSVLKIIENELTNEGILCTPDKKPGFFKVIKVEF